MNVNHAGVEALGDHDYLIRVAQDDDLVTIQMRANPEVVVRIAGPDADEARVVATTVRHLFARQRPDELSEQLDLDDVIVAYDGYFGELQNEFAHAR